MAPRDRLPPPRPRRDRSGGRDPAASTGVAPNPTVPPAPAETPAPPPAKVDPLVGRSVGRCVLEAKIGAGRTSVVYRARHTGIDGTVAVKVLLPDVVSQPTFVERFEQEARAIARLDHENILKIYDVLREGDLHGIVMELLEGETVLEFLEREGRVAPIDALRIVKQAALGLSAAHAKRILHRDVKPQNLVVLPDGLLKVVDFGLAEEGGSTEGSRIGTPHYMAPEIWESKPPESRSDVYALGITLYHLLVGQPPYSGLPLKGIMAGHVEGKALWPELKVPGLGKPICDLVRDMTKRDPLARIDLDEVVERIDGIGGEEIRTPGGVRLRAMARRRAALKGRGPSPVVLALGALAVAGIGVAILASGGGGDAPDRAGGGTAHTPSAPVLPTPPSPPARDPSADQKRAEAAQARQAEAAKVAEAERALEAADAFARETWQDLRAVVRRYRTVNERFPDTPSGTEAKRRADDVARGRRHPHPDRTLVSKDALAEAVAAWEAARPAYEEAIAAKSYDAALALVPAGVEGATGAEADDIAFHRTLATHLGRFLLETRRALSDLPTGERSILWEGETRRVLALDEAALFVATPGGTKKVPWVDLPPDTLTDLGQRLLGNRTAREGVLLVAFAYGHRLADPFWAALLAARVAKAEPADVAALAAYEARAAARFAK